MDPLYFDRILEQALLSQAEESALARSWRRFGDHAARNRLIQARLRLVPLPRDLRATCRPAPVAGGVTSQPTRTHSIEIEPPSIPSTGKATASLGRCIPST